MLKVLLVHPDGMQNQCIFAFFTERKSLRDLDFTCRRHGRSVKQHDELKRHSVVMYLYTPK